MMRRGLIHRAAGKDIRFGAEARQLMMRGVERIVGAVATTLGPKGRNVILEQSYGVPKITKDGVTVAKAIEFKDPFENLGAQLVRQVCNKTNDVAGDGTTTAAVLVASIFGEGYKSVAQGMNPVDMKRGIDKAVGVVVEALAKQARTVTKKEEIVQVATISANGEEELGRLIGEAMEKVGKDGVITTQDGKTLQTELEHVEGLSIDRGLVSPFFVTDAKTQKCELDEALVLVSAKKISSAQVMLPVLNHIARTGKPLLVVADDVDGDALTTMIFNKLHGKIKVVAVKAPGFGDNKNSMLQDLAIFTGAQVVGDDTGVSLDVEHFNDTVLGSVKRLTVGKDNAVLLSGGGDGASVKERVELLREQISQETSDYNREKLQERLARLSNGVAVIRVGGASEVEMSERKDRITDALCATRAAVQEGIVAGGGSALLHASLSLDALLADPTLTSDQKTGVTIVRNAVRLPTHRIGTNSGKEGAVIVDKVLEMKSAEMGYDAAKDRYVNMFEAGIIDPTRVVRVCLVDSASTAGMMITTEAAICDLPKEEKGGAGAMGGAGMGGMGGMGGMDY